MKVTWSVLAKHDLADIASWIAQDNPGAARAQVHRILERTRQLAIFPQSGRMVLEYRDPHVREVVEGSYRIIYRLLPGETQVISVLQARRLPTSPEAL